MPCDTNTHCQDERVSQHHKASGHGPVKDDEYVIFVVFDSNVQIGKKLSERDFSTKKIAKGDLSLARKAYTTINDAQECVIQPALDRGQKVSGASVALTRSLRSIKAPIEGLTPVKYARGVCILDRVENDDHEGHAALRSCRDEGALTPKQRGKLRALIAADLAEKFDVLQAIADVFTLSAANIPSIVATPGR